MHANKTGSLAPERVRQDAPPLDPRSLTTHHIVERIAELRAGAGGSAEELSALYRELVLRRPPPRQARARTPLQSAHEVADVLIFDVPPSHRKNYGAAITSAKRALVSALRPVFSEILRPQRTFNISLANVLQDVIGGTSPQGRSGAAWVHDVLDPLSVPREWKIESHRSGLSGAAVNAAKSTIVRGGRPALERLLDRQRQWNLRAIELTALAASGELPEVDAANKRIAELAALNDPFPANGRLSRAASPIAAELFRRQQRFNTEIMLVLSDLLRGRPPVVAPAPSDYREWYQKHEPAELARSRRSLANLTERPLISLVVPAYETPPRILRACLDSVRAQLYDNWELCVVDDGSEGRQVRDILSDYAARDPRIRWRALEKNAGIAAATNAAIELARGEWIAFLDHDDELAPHALAEVALRVSADPELDWVYSDEDRISIDGERHNPFFKPDWSPDLLRSVNYICHFVAVRASLAREVRLRDGFQGSQDFDFLLRLSERSERVAHIPKILYHWRSSPISLSQDASKLKAASEVGKRALREHFERRGVDAVVDDPQPTEYRVRYRPRGEPLVSIIVPFKDRPELLERLTHTLFSLTQYKNFELLLVSNNSTDSRTFELLDRLEDPRIRKLTWDFPFNYPAANNFAAREAKGELLLFLNNDMEIVDPNWLDVLVGQAQRPEVGAVGPKLLFPDGSIQHAGVVVGICGYAAHPFWRFPNDRRWTFFGNAEWDRNYLAVTSACMMMRRELFEALGGFDETFRLCGSDVDIGIRATRMGKRVVYTAATWLYHHESASRRTQPIPEEDHWRSVVAYRDVLQRGDPFYNPNLTLASTDCDLKWETTSAEELALEPLAAFCAAHLADEAPDSGSC